MRSPPCLKFLLLHPGRAPARASARLSAHPFPRPWSSRWREFAPWQYWLPLLAVASILLAGGGTWESVIWLVLRFIAIACVVMAVVSLVQPVGRAELLRRHGWWGLRWP